MSVGRYASRCDYRVEPRIAASGNRVMRSRTGQGAPIGDYERLPAGRAPQRGSAQIIYYGLGWDLVIEGPRGAVQIPRDSATPSYTSAPEVGGLW